MNHILRYRIQTKGRFYDKRRSKNLSPGNPTLKMSTYYKLNFDFPFYALYAKEDVHTNHALVEIASFDFKKFDGQESRNFVTSWSVHVRMSRIMANIKAVKRKTLNAEKLYEQFLILG